jgi:hypothetical protein
MVDCHSLGYVFIITENRPCISQISYMAHPFALPLSDEDKAAGGASFS